MKKGHTHSEASPISDKIVFNKVMILLLSFLQNSIPHNCDCNQIWLTTSVVLFLWLFSGKARVRRKCTAYSIWSSASFYTCRSFSKSGVMCSCSARIWYAVCIICCFLFKCSDFLCSSLVMTVCDYNLPPPGLR